MATQTKIEANVRQAVPFFRVSSMEASLRFYVDGLGFAMTRKWTADGDGKVRWCWLELGNAALMLQEFKRTIIRIQAVLMRSWELAFPSASNAKTRWLFTKISGPARSPRRGHSSGTECGSRPCKIPMATNSSSKV